MLLWSNLKPSTISRDVFQKDNDCTADRQTIYELTADVEKQIYMFASPDSRDIIARRRALYDMVAAGPPLGVLLR